MKKLSFYFLLIFCCTSLCELRAQAYTPMVVEGARWRIYEQVPNSTPPLPYIQIYEHFIQGDTLINNIAYKKTYHRFLASVNQNYSAGRYFLCIFQRKILFHALF